MADPSIAAAAEEMSHDKITRDPRTRLPIIDVPPIHAKNFRGLQGTVIHWLGVVDKFNRMRKLDRRVAIFSDSHVYLCRLDGGITRCVQVRNISRAFIGDDSAIGFQINAPDYDMLIQVLNVQEREAVLNVVKSVYFRLVGRDLGITILSDDASVAMLSELKLTRPPGAQLREPIRSLKSLMKMLEEQKKREEDDRKVVANEFMQIKEGLRQELQQYRTDEYERMVEQLSKHVKALEEKDRPVAPHKKKSKDSDCIVA